MMRARLVGAALAVGLAAVLGACGDDGDDGGDEEPTTTTIVGGADAGEVVPPPELTDDIDVDDLPAPPASPSPDDAEG